MRPQPANKLDPRVRSAWRINAAIWITLGGAGALGISAIFMAFEETRAFGNAALIVAVCALIVLYLLFLIVLPPIRYARWRYEISPEFLDIAKGIIWRKRYTVPFIRVQNTDTRQGPVLRAFGLSAVTVATAAAEHQIPGLDTQAAAELRDRAAELARLAREDV